MIEETTDRLLREARQTLEDARAEISDAVGAMEAGSNEPVEDFLASAMTRLKILDEQIKRHQEHHGRVE